MSCCELTPLGHTQVLQVSFSHTPAPAPCPLSSLEGCGHVEGGQARCALS